MRIRLVHIGATSDERIDRDTVTPERQAWDVVDDDADGAPIGRVHEEMDPATGRAVFVASVFDRDGRFAEKPQHASRSVEEAVAARADRGRDLDARFNTLEEAVAAVESHGSGHAPGR